MTVTDRRRFLLTGAGAGAALLVAAPRVARAEEDEVSPTEDLMREHGVLRRILIVYGEAAQRLDGTSAFPVEVIARSAQIVRAFIEDYHERDEEEFIFPPLEKAGKLTALTATLRRQHEAGRALTATIQRLSAKGAALVVADRRELSSAMRQFSRMYEAHAAHEDTDLFPAFARLVGKRQLKKLQETFEKKEKALPMGDFDKMVRDVGAIEHELGIDDLARFTPAKP